MNTFDNLCKIIDQLLREAQSFTKGSFLVKVTMVVNE